MTVWLLIKTDGFTSLEVYMASLGEQGITQHGVHGGCGWSLSLADVIMEKETNEQAHQLVLDGLEGSQKNYADHTK